ncbi:MAG: hypothetical protein IVW54_22890 [Candidatus Binataceae bacterium]|nr:hypothetical protein [Candidatus Binataceae bacterium]
MRLQIPIGARTVAEYQGWTLYELPRRERDSFLWQKFKLMRSPGEKAKWGEHRVYRLAWHCVELRFAADRYLVHLRTKLPDLYAYVDLHLSLNYTRERLLATQDEIAAEYARLKELRNANRRAKTTTEERT